MRKMKMRKLGPAALLALCLAAAVPVPSPAHAADGRLLGLFSRRALVTGPSYFRTWAFTDTAESRAQEDFVLLAALGVFRGPSGPDGPAQPQAIVSRAELTALVVRLLGQDALAQRYKEEGVTPPYADADAIPEWARGYAGAAAALGMVKGLPDPEGGLLFAADQPVRFGDAVTIIARALRQDSGRQWPDGARLALDTVLAARLDKDRAEPINRDEMAVLLVNALRAGRYNPATGTLDPELSLLHNPFFTYQGIVDEIRPMEGTLRLRREGDPDRRWEVRYLAQRVYLRGVADPRDLVGRRITAIDAGPEGVVYIDAR